MSRFRIGQVARSAGVGVETIRFYERKGLLDEPPRRASGYRAYPPEAVARVRFIRQAKALGFSLKEIRGLLDLKVDQSNSAAEVKRRAQDKVTEIDRKVADLRQIRRALLELTDCCSSRGNVGDCPIIDALESDPRGWPSEPSG